MVITHLIDSEIRKTLKGICLGTRIPCFILVNDVLAFEIKILFLTLKIVLNLNLNAT